MLKEQKIYFVLFDFSNPTNYFLQINKLFLINLRIAFIIKFIVFISYHKLISL